MPVSPQITVSPQNGSSTIGWSTEAGQPVRWSALLPIGGRTTISDELALRGKGETVWRDYLDPAELRYHVRLMPPVEQPWDTFLNVIQVGQPGDIELIRQTGEVDGVRLSRQGLADVVAIFNARPSTPLIETADAPHASVLRNAHIRRTGYSVRWNANATSTTVYMLDLDPQKVWTVQVDGRPSSQPFTVDPSALPSVTISGLGSHTIQLTAVGDIESPR